MLFLCLYIMHSACKHFWYLNIVESALAVNVYY